MLSEGGAISGFDRNVKYQTVLNVIILTLILNNLMQQGNFIDVFLARHVSGTYAHHQEL